MFPLGFHGQEVFMYPSLLLYRENSDSDLTCKYFFLTASVASTQTC